MGYLNGDDALTSPEIADPGLPPDSFDPCDPSSVAFDVSQCGRAPGVVDADDGSGQYTLPVEVFNEGLRYACVYGDSSVEMLADRDYSGVGACPMKDSDVVQVWDVVGGVSVWKTPAPASKPSLFSIVQRFLDPGSRPAGGAPPRSLPPVLPSSGGTGLAFAVAALALIGFMSVGKKGKR